MKSHLQKSDLSPLPPLPNSSFRFWRNEKPKQKMTFESRQQQQANDFGHLSLSSSEEEDLEARSVLCLVEVEEQCGSRSCLDSSLYIDGCIKVEVETTDQDYSPCIVLDIVQEDSQAPRRGCDHHGNINGDDLLAFTKKAAGEKASDSLNNRWRKYKRSAPFDSGKIVIVFSVMSSLGTLILIYLTVRVKLIGDGYAHS